MHAVERRDGQRAVQALVVVDVLLVRQDSNVRRRVRAARVRPDAHAACVEINAIERASADGVEVMLAAVVRRSAAKFDFHTAHGRTRPARAAARAAGTASAPARGQRALPGN